jgi:hypothetical protein
MLYILNPDTKWIKLDQFEAPAGFIHRKSAPLPSVSPKAFTDTNLSRKTPYGSTGIALLTHHSSANRFLFIARQPYMGLCLLVSSRFHDHTFETRHSR